MNQLLSQIQELQDKVNSLNAEKEFYDPDTASSSGMSHVLSQPSRISSPGGTVSRDSCLPHGARNSMGTSGHVFEDQPVLEGAIPIILRGPKEFLASSSCELRPGNTGSTKRHGEGLRRDPPSSTIVSYWRNLFSKLYDGCSEVFFLGIAFRKIPRLRWLSMLESQFQDRSVCECTVPSTHNVVDQ